MTQDTPIIVNPDPTPAQIGVALRYAVTLLGGYLVGKGWIDGDLVQVVAAIVTTLAPVIYASWRAYRQKQTQVTLARAAPDDVATVKGDVPAGDNAPALAARLKGEP